MNIKILGSGCANCQKLEANAREAAERVGVEVTIEKVSDIAQIMGYGVMSTPALLIDDSLKAAGRVVPVDEIVEMLQA